jgi:hypothetical protein
VISPLPPPAVLQHEGFWVVRDDFIAGGSKRRALPACFTEEHDEYVFCSPAVGFAQLALAYACADFGLQATVVTAKRQQRHPNTAMAASLGAHIIECQPGRLSQVEKVGRDYAEENGALLIPLGLADPRVEERQEETARELAAAAEAENIGLTNVWCAVGAGMLARALGRAFPHCRIHAVAVGRVPRPGDLPPGCELHIAPEKFEEPAKRRPPWPSASHYDAKIWQFAEGTSAAARPRHLIWNVA